MISITTLQVHGAKGHDAHFLAPMSQVRCSLSAILYVDDTDLLHLNMDTNESVQEVHIALQRAIENWGQLLIATGGSLKPEKCFLSSAGLFCGPNKEGGNTSHIARMIPLQSTSCYLMELCQGPVDVVIPNTAAAEAGFEMLNKQPAGHLYHLLPTFGASPLFVKTIRCQSMEVGLTTEVPLCTYDPKTQILTTS